MWFRSAQIAFTALLSVCIATSAAAASSVLVVLEDRAMQSSYSKFWSMLQEKHEVSFRSIKDKTPPMVDLGDRQFDNVLFFAPSAKKLPDDLSVQQLVKHLQEGGNLFIGLDTTVSEMWRDFGREFDLEVPLAGTSVLSYFDAPNRDEPDSLAIPLNEDPSIKVAYRGTGIGRGVSPLLQSFLTAPFTAFSTDLTASETMSELEEAGEIFLKGSDINLAIGMQTLNNARVGWIGSLDFFKDSTWDSFTGQHNQPFARKLLDWSFKQSGVVSIVRSHHFKAGDVSEHQPEEYTLRDQITYKIQLAQPNPADVTQFVPFTTSDLQVTLSLINPYVRITVPPTNIVTLPNGQAQEYEVTFAAPDKHGVYWLGVDWRRPRMTIVSERHRVSLVPPKHNEYPRFLSAAYPYYASVLSTSASFVFFCAFWLATRPPMMQPQPAKVKKVE